MLSNIVPPSIIAGDRKGRPYNTAPFCGF
jgi:hypothetical protein